MKALPRSQLTLVALTLVNLCILGATLARDPAIAASSDGILRGRGLEITDGAGHVRASIAIHPASRQADGTVYPETVLLRLVTAKGRPIVKIASSEDGAAMALSAADGPAYVQLLSRGNAPTVLVVDGSGKQTVTLP